MLLAALQTPLAVVGKEVERLAGCVEVEIAWEEQTAEETEDFAELMSYYVDPVVADAHCLVAGLASNTCSQVEADFVTVEAYWTGRV